MVRELEFYSQFFQSEYLHRFATEIYTKKEMMKKDKRDAMINLEPRGQCFFWGGLPLCSNKFELSDFRDVPVNEKRDRLNQLSLKVK